MKPDTDTRVQSPSDETDQTSTLRDSDSDGPPVIRVDGDLSALAYSYWQQRGCPHGCPEEDWFRAEKELAARQSSK